MKRRDFVNAGITALATSAFNPAAGGAHAGARPNSQARVAVCIAIENGSYRAGVDSESGLILRLLDKKRPVHLITEPSLADNFTPLLPLPDLEANYIYGREQQLCSHEKTANRLTLTWNGPLKNPRGSFDVDIVLRIAFEENQIQSYPTPMPMPWISLYNRQLNWGMYFARFDTVSRYKAVRFELHPGTGSRQYGGNWPRAEELDAAFPLGLKLHWACYPYTREGGNFQGPPVVLEFHDGDWHRAAEVISSVVQISLPYSRALQEFGCDANWPSPIHPSALGSIYSPTQLKGNSD